MRKEKSYWNLKWSQKQELDNYEIDKFQSISTSGIIYPLRILHGRMRILYRSIQRYSSIEENTFLKERGMLGPYITSVVPYYFQCSPLLLFLYPCNPHIVIIVPLHYYCQVCYDYIVTHGLLYIEGGHFICIIQELFIYVM